jgi:septum formation protein
VKAETLVLASASPRRADYLRMLGIPFEVDPADVDESWIDGESPEAHVDRLARAKAFSVGSRHPSRAVLGGDTVVVLDGVILGKPRDAEDAVGMLLQLQGRDHVVVSGLALLAETGDMLSGISKTRVRLRDFERADAEAYVATGEPLDKAGAYGIQGKGATLVDAIEGDYYTVVGLPIPLMLDLLRRSGRPYDFGRAV